MDAFSMTNNNNSTHNVALVLEGGGFRGIFTAAVLDAYQESGLFFRYMIGVSAGAAYSVSYVARQYRRNLEVNRYVNDPRYCSFKNLLKTGSYFNWSFIYHEIPLQYVPFDYHAYSQSDSRLKVVVTDIATGLPEYYELRTECPEEFRDWLSATSALPMISKPISINGHQYMDGGLCDSIPVAKALADGNERAVVVLTRPKGYRKKPSRSSWLLRFRYRRYPKLVQCIRKRTEEYNAKLDLIDRLEQEGRVFVIRPDNGNLVSRLENNPKKLSACYDSAVVQMEKEMSRLERWLDVYH
ncbi:patatin-like phospholipase family protein [Alkalitalea saponilacus]|uniref:Predicted phospholipase, patatin/cPLA2 family n=1 Tax=Alkalitalea saponilacus TaxID=889453 RepID=A0A1T5HSE5_9BACT|nr:patatin family protein [Alkalitalea saponilacus]ASB47688.1 patatin family protein [Alkalitalea saponilacus]SKC23613.1 Predicted phospholipase, patatin/cPLA2 family [Alkalitalea saponilacus]